jgi:hypothetical protein
MTNALTSLNLIADVTAWTEFQPPASGEYSRGSATSGFFAEASEIPADFLEALDDFSHGRVVSDEIALNQPPPNA